MSNAKDRASLAEQAYRVLEKRLVMLDLPPGSQVSEGELIRLTGYGRTPVREAIQRLAQHELFRVISQEGPDGLSCQKRSAVKNSRGPKAA